MQHPIIIRNCVGWREKTMQGSALMMMIMLLLGIALMLLSVLHRFYQAEWRNGQDEIAFYQADAGAASALAWGMTLRWSRSEFVREPLYCRTAADPALKSCLRRLKENRFLLQGSSFSPWFRKNISHYQLVTATVQGNEMTLTALAQGWSDFCPPDLKPGCAGYSETGGQNE